MSTSTVKEDIEPTGNKPNDCSGHISIILYLSKVLKAGPSHPLKESYFSCLYAQSSSFSHDPTLMTIVFPSGMKMDH